MPKQVGKTYHVVVEPNEVTKKYAHEDFVALDRMELTFTIHPKAPRQDPREIVGRTLSNMFLLGVMEITSITEVELK